MSENEHHHVNADDVWALLRVVSNSLMTVMAVAPRDLPHEAAYKIGIAQGAVSAAINILGAHIGADASADDPIRDQQKREDVAYRMSLTTFSMESLQRIATLEQKRVNGDIPTHTSGRRARQRLGWVNAEIAGRG